MIEQLPPEATEPSDPQAGEDGSDRCGQQMTIYDLIDEIANATGTWGPSENHDGGARYRRNLRRGS